jgi:hypothetical protein
MDQTNGMLILNKYLIQTDSHEARNSSIIGAPHESNLKRTRVTDEVDIMMMTMISGRQMTTASLPSDTALFATTTTAAGLR